ncbi:WecB/TagA/CpsF family glycosyltransferase [Kocuria rosea]|uniref:WecB/TagA/CpsF family glycosyltransferase n=1 Tax=Kocuria rosea TaxID=1275 RepID=UPI000E02DC29|nr:WecB/TagA/CpsF family glycosyltransferase [Kocuria rosea]STX04987.1 Putative N-acetylmannosaminyltransferase [Kocuria rosea]
MTNFHNTAKRTRGVAKPTADTVKLCGIEIMATSAAEAATDIIKTAQERQPIAYHFVNAYTISLTAKNSALRQVLTQGVALPDGKPLTLLARIKASTAQQVRGPSTFEAVFQQSQKVDIKHYLLGSSAETLSRLVARLKQKYPDVAIAGFYSPPYHALSPTETEHQDSMIRSSGADIVWVGLGTPKQDFEAQRIAHQLGVTTAAVGAAFDFSAGTKREAPPWMATVGLEWAFRLCTEPRRLWKRYMFGNAIFIKQAAIHWFDR